MLLNHATIIVIRNLKLRLRVLSFIKELIMQNKVLAVVDGREIKQSDLFNLLQSIGQNAASFQSAEGQKQLIDELVMQELLYSDALAQGLQNEEAYKNAVEEMSKTILKQYAMKKLLDTIDATDDEVKEYYDNHTSLFTTPEKAAANHILVDTEEEAQKIADEIKNGLDFKEAAMKYSSCPSSSQGGALGEFTRGQMVPEFEETTFSMTPGAISEPVKTQFGYHLIQLESLQTAGTMPFEAAKAQVKEQLLLTKRQALYLSKREELGNRYTVDLK